MVSVSPDVDREGLLTLEAGATRPKFQVRGDAWFGTDAALTGNLRGASAAHRNVAPASGREDAGRPTHEHIAAADYILAKRFDEVPGPPAQWAESEPLSHDSRAV